MSIWRWGGPECCAWVYACLVMICFGSLAMCQGGWVLPRPSENISRICVSHWPPYHVCSLNEELTDHMSRTENPYTTTQHSCHSPDQMCVHWTACPPLCFSHLFWVVSGPNWMTNPPSPNSPTPSFQPVQSLNPRWRYPFGSWPKLPHANAATLTTRHIVPCTPLSSTFAACAAHRSDSYCPPW